MDIEETVQRVIERHDALLTLVKILVVALQVDDPEYRRRAADVASRAIEGIKRGQTQANS